MTKQTAYSGTTKIFDNRHHSGGAKDWKILQPTEGKMESPGNLLQIDVKSQKSNNRKHSAMEFQ
jgi:hypothetical protein